MAYQALYRRLRPQRFEDVIGQEHIIRTLKNQIEKDRINHAYLFCGTRGTGKTTTAKIFARAINCTGQGEKPCNECQVCKEALKGTNLNIIEIDAASNNSVDNIRDIVEEVKYPPTEGRYKVYIIDEVHMLTASAFNALLKTLEEPPAHVVFILATTDPQKMPVTVLSRCQRFDFHRIGHKDMVSVLKEYMESEKADVDISALEYIAEISDGAMRDALSVLDQCLSFYYDRTITENEVREITGATDRGAFFEITQAMNVNDSGRCMEIIDDIVINGRDIQQFVQDFILHLRNLLLAVSVNKKSKALDYSKDYIDKLREQGCSIGYDYLLILISNFSELSNQMKYSPNPRILLEVCCIKGCNPVTGQDYGSVAKRMTNIERAIEKGVAVSQSKAEELSAQAINAQEINTEEVKEKTIEKAVPDDIKEVISTWRKFVSSLNTGIVKAMLGAVTPAFIDGDIMYLVCPTNGHLVILTKHIEDIIKSITKFYSKEFNIKLILEKNYNTMHSEVYGAKDNSIKPLTQDRFAVLGDNVNFID